MNATVMTGVSVPSSSIRKVAIASFTGTAIEWYDFFLYNVATAVVFHQLFFPKGNNLAGHAASIHCLRGRFRRAPDRRHRLRPLRRPDRSQIDARSDAPHHGDRDLLIGLLPTYESIGIWAPILLVLLRVAQGFGVGGEWGGAVLMAVEHSPTKGNADFTGAGRRSASLPDCCSRPSSSDRSQSSPKNPLLVEEWDGGSRFC